MAAIKPQVERTAEYSISTGGSGWRCTTTTMSSPCCWGTSAKSPFLPARADLPEGIAPMAGRQAVRLEPGMYGRGENERFLAPFVRAVPCLEACERETIDRGGEPVRVVEFEVVARGDRRHHRVRPRIPGAGCLPAPGRGRERERPCRYRPLILLTGSVFRLCRQRSR